MIREIKIQHPPSNGAAAPAQQRITTPSEQFRWLDAMMADSRLDARAKVVGYCIVQHYNRAAGVTQFVSDEVISDKTDIANRWVRRARNALREAGWINWKRIPNKPNVYSILTEPMAGIAEQQQKLKQQRKERYMERQQRQPSPERPHVAEPELPPQTIDGNPERPWVAHPERPQVAEPVRPQVADIPLSTYPLNEPLKESRYIRQADSDFKNAANSNPSGSNSDFETFWQQYPLKVGKLKAAQAYARVRKSGISAEVLLAGAGRFAAERAGQDPQFTKHPTTWLNGGCWTDEPQPQSKFTKPNRLSAAAAGMRGFMEEGYHRDRK